MPKRYISQTWAEIRKPDPNSIMRRGKWFRQIIPVIAITATVSMLSGCRRSTALSEVDRVDNAFKARKGDLAIEVTESGSIKAISLTNTAEMIAEVGIQENLVDKVRPEPKP